MQLRLIEMLCTICRECYCRRILPVNGCYLFPVGKWNTLRIISGVLHTSTIARERLHTITAVVIKNAFCVYRHPQKDYTFLVSDLIQLETNIEAWFLTHVATIVQYLSNNDNTMEHEMETFSSLLALCAGNPPVTGEFGEFPSQRPVSRSFDIFFDLRLNNRLSKQWWGWWFESRSRPSWCHCNDIDTIVTLQYRTWIHEILHVCICLCNIIS